jgi:hypothetical protein
MVHNNPNLSDVQRFYYLRTSLEGDAVQVIQSMNASGSNYELALTLLKERYENKPLIIKNHIKMIFELSPIVKESHVALIIIDLFPPRAHYHSEKRWIPLTRKRARPMFCRGTSSESNRCRPNYWIGTKRSKN